MADWAAGGRHFPLMPPPARFPSLGGCRFFPVMSVGVQALVLGRRVNPLYDRSQTHLVSSYSADTHLTPTVCQASYEAQRRHRCLLCPGR